jgi:hypothetical protein
VGNNLSYTYDVYYTGDDDYSSFCSYSNFHKSFDVLQIGVDQIYVLSRKYRT